MSKIYSNIKERVLHIAESQEDSKQIFFTKVGLKYSNFTGKSKESDLNSKAVAEILLIYKEINPYWLLMGQGEMLLKDQGQLAGVSEREPVHNKESNAIEDIIAAKVVERLQPTLDKFQAIDIYLAEKKLDELDKRIP